MKIINAIFKMEIFFQQWFIRNKVLYIRSKVTNFFVLQHKFYFILFFREKIIFSFLNSIKYGII